MLFIFDYFNKLLNDNPLKIITIAIILYLLLDETNALNEHLTINRVYHINESNINKASQLYSKFKNAATVNKTTGEVIINKPIKVNGTDPSKCNQLISGTINNNGVITPKLNFSKNSTTNEFEIKDLSNINFKITKDSPITVDRVTSLNTLETDKLSLNAPNDNFKMTSKTAAKFMCPNGYKFDMDKNDKAVFCYGKSGNGGRGQTCMLHGNENHGGWHQGNKSCNEAFMKDDDTPYMAVLWG